MNSTWNIWFETTFDKGEGTLFFGSPSLNSVYNNRLIFAEPLFENMHVPSPWPCFKILGRNA